MERIVSNFPLLYVLRAKLAVIYSEDQIQDKP